MEPVDFVKNPHDKVTIQHCMDFLLTCVKEMPNGAELDEFKGCLFDGIGMNNHKGKRYNDELQIPSKKKFENNQHALSKGFKDLCIPSNAALVE